MFTCRVKSLYANRPYTIHTKASTTSFLQGPLATTSSAKRCNAFGHQKVASYGQVPGTLIFCEPQSVRRQSPNFGSPASTSVTHAVSPADSLRGQSTYQHEEPSWHPNRGTALPQGSLAGDHPGAMAFSDTVVSTMTRCKSAFFTAAMASTVSMVVFKSTSTPASPSQTQVKHLGNTTSRL